MAVLFAMRRGVTTLLFPSRNDTWAGNPSGSSSHLPYKAEEFCLRMDNQFCLRTDNECHEMLVKTDKLFRFG